MWTPEADDVANPAASVAEAPERSEKRGDGSADRIVRPTVGDVCAGREAGQPSGAFDKREWQVDWRNWSLVDSLQTDGRYVMEGRTPVCLILLFALTVSRTGQAQTLDLQGQLSSWAIFNAEAGPTAVLGLRYIPTFTFNQPFASERAFDVELAANTFASGPIDDSIAEDGSAKAKPYRVWGRFKSTRFEARVGLQKLNFGSATLLRPLMWFDSVDPRDPLQITDGVYGALFRYYLPNKATIWTWGLYGNTSLKGFESSPTRKNTPEFGGRFELPVPRGQVAFTTHHRRADIGRGVLADLNAGSPVTPEHRYAIDGKFDVAIGLWFEAMVSHQTRPDLFRPDQRALNVGADYTLGLGNGIYVLGEYFVLENSQGIFQHGDEVRLAAATLRYPVGILDAISGILYVDATRHDTYRFVSWQRSYDRWQFYVMGFWNPRRASSRPAPARRPGRVRWRVGEYS
jgi:hypothetical protein